MKVIGFFLLVLFTTKEFLFLNEELVVILCFSSLVVALYSALKVLLQSALDNSIAEINEQASNFATVATQQLKKNIAVSRQKEEQLLLIDSACLLGLGELDETERLLNDDRVVAAVSKGYAQYEIAVSALGLPNADSTQKK
jgi:hypothetical protein